MNLIQQVTTDPVQTRTIVLADGTLLTFTMTFVPMQYGWFITNLVYTNSVLNINFTLNGLRITNSPNMLYQFKNQIPFGIGCFSVDDREPSQAGDFASGASQLYILPEADVQAYTDFLTGET